MVKLMGFWSRILTILAYTQEYQTHPLIITHMILCKLEKICTRIPSALHITQDKNMFLEYPYVAPLITHAYTLLGLSHLNVPDIDFTSLFPIDAAQAIYTPLKKKTQILSDEKIDEDLQSCAQKFDIFKKNQRLLKKITQIIDESNTVSYRTQQLCLLSEQQLDKPRAIAKHITKNTRSAIATHDGEKTALLVRERNTILYFVTFYENMIQIYQETNDITRSDVEKALIQDNMYMFMGPYLDILHLVQTAHQRLLMFYVSTCMKNCQNHWDMLFDAIHKNASIELPPLTDIPASSNPKKQEKPGSHNLSQHQLNTFDAFMNHEIAVDYHDIESLMNRLGLRINKQCGKGSHFPIQRFDPNSNTWNAIGTCVRPHGSGDGNPCLPQNDMSRVRQLFTDQGFVEEKKTYRP
jgi:hypothetical protein